MHGLFQKTKLLTNAKEVPSQHDQDECQLSCFDVVDMR